MWIASACTSFGGGTGVTSSTSRAVVLSMMDCMCAMGMSATLVDTVGVGILGDGVGDWCGGDSRMIGRDGEKRAALFALYLSMMPPLVVGDMD